MTFNEYLELKLFDLKVALCIMLVLGIAAMIYFIFKKK